MTVTDMTINKKSVCKMIDDVLVSYLIDKKFFLRKYQKEESGQGIFSVFPMGVLVRIRGSRELDMVEVQFDKSGENKFIINFGICDKDGIVTPWGHHIAAEKASPSDLPSYYSVHSSGFFGRWFSIQNEMDMKKTSSVLMDVGKSIDDWFVGGVLPKNTRKKGFR